MPPNADPLTPLVHPLQWRMNDLIGTAMALRLEQAGKSGVIYSVLYDAYWPGGTKNTACLKNVIGLLTEVASVGSRLRSTSIPTSCWRAGGRARPITARRPTSPTPGRAAAWRLRDIVDYELIAGNSLLETCSSYRADLLRTFWQMGRNAVAQGQQEGPFAYVIPPDQHDATRRPPPRWWTMLREHGLEAQRARAPRSPPRTAARSRKAAWCSRRPALPARSWSR